MTTEGQVEVEIVVPTLVQLRLDAPGLARLQTALHDFSSRLAASSCASSCTNAVLEGRALGSGEEAGAPAPLSLCLALDGLQFEAVEGRNAAALTERLLFHLAPVRCRYVQLSNTALKVCCLGQDLRLLGVQEGVAEPEQFVRPWYEPLLRPSCGAEGSLAGIHLSVAHPWEVRRPQRRRTLVYSVFDTIQQSSWLDTHSLVLEVEKGILGVDETSVSAKIGRMLFNAHPHMHDVMARLISFVSLPPESSSSTQSSGRSARSADPNASSGSTFRLCVADALVDFPSAAYARTWPITSPHGLTSPTQRPSSRGLDTDKWRAVAHLSGFDVSFRPSQGVKACCGDLNLHLIDHPSNLARLDIISEAKRPSILLASMGFAHLLSISDASAVWRPQSKHESACRMSTVPIGESFDVNVSCIAVNLRADSVKCLLSSAIELADAIPQWKQQHSIVEGEQGQRGVDSDFGKSARASFADSSTHLKYSGAVAKAPTGSLVSGGSDVDVLDNVDFLAFGDSGSPQRPPPEAQHGALSSCMIEDYILQEENLQLKRSPLLLAAASPDESDMAAFDLDVQAEASPGTVAVCLLDPDAYPEEQLSQLCMEDRAARLEVENACGVQRSEDRGRNDSPLAAFSYPDPNAPSPVVHQDGNAIKWHVDPGELHVVQDHFDGLEKAVKNPTLKQIDDTLPLRITVAFSCDAASLSIASGSDFSDEARSRMRAQESQDAASHSSTRTPHLSIELEHTKIKLLSFEESPAAFTASSVPLSEDPQFTEVMGDMLRQQLVVSVRDFGVVDRLPGSVFSHLLSFFEDERVRPRPNSSDMLYLRLDEVVPRPMQGSGCSRPKQQLTASSRELEYRADLRLLPLRLTIDQDVVDFLAEFLQLCALPTYVEEDSNEAPGAAASSSQPLRSSAENMDAQRQSRRAAPTSASVSADVLFQHVSIAPLLVAVDYRAKRLDVDALKRGDLWELVNLLPLLEGLEVAFKRVELSGILGFSKVLQLSVTSWSKDLNRTQILRSLTGVTPIRSFANIGGGFADLVLQPLRQYRDGADSQQISRTLFRGLASFIRHVTVESIDLTERIFVGTQAALEHAAAYLQEQQAPSSSSSRVLGDRRALPPAAHRPGVPRSSAATRDPDEADAEDSWVPVRRGASDFLQPGGAAEGLQEACTSLQRGVLRAGEAVIARPLLEFRSGASKEKVLRSMAKGIPMCVLRPVIGATSAATTALRGVRNSVDPTHHQEIVRKYKGPE
eukprot:TRINITY_DN18017_c0_g1_i1.p1 TRINITY_DN18017_c0_g1~~TRINITY_DN18017_c0_g1_i1.p1  ORF type:complete len:1244 (-),score=197.61 TRINITY_DN18017_c0_g1_i1:87-3818(-)